MTITILVTDFNGRKENVIMPFAPRQGEGFQWDASAPLYTIQSIAWIGNGANTGTMAMTVG